MFAGCTDGAIIEITCRVPGGFRSATWRAIIGIGMATVRALGR